MADPLDGASASRSFLPAAMAPARPRTDTLLLVSLLIAAGAATLGCKGPAMGWPDGPVESADRLAAYKREHYREIGDEPVEELPLPAVVAAAARERLVFLGDHHLDYTLHDLHLRLLHALHQRGTRIALAVECYGTEDQASVDAFLRRELDMPSLRQLLRERWNQSWLDGTAVDSRYYRDLLRFARDAELPVTALEPTPRLALDQRDPTMAVNLQSALAAWPDRTLVVVVGHAHLLGPGHLRDRIARPSLVVAARPSDELAHRMAFQPTHEDFIRTETGIVVPTRWTP